MIYDMIYDIYPRLMTKVNVSPTMGMSATVEEMSATVGKLNMLIKLKKLKTREYHSQLCIGYF